MLQCNGTEEPPGRIFRADIPELSFLFVRCGVTTLSYRRD
jgi:hypothetical protein